MTHSVPDSREDVQRNPAARCGHRSLTRSSSVSPWSRGTVLIRAAWIVSWVLVR